jgi:hypothetical protein
VSALDLPGAEILAPQSYPDVYSRTNVIGIVPPKVAAGADITATVPVGVIWNVVSLSATFTASAAVANRTISFQVKAQDGSVVYQYALNTALTAGQILVLEFSEDVVTIPTGYSTTNSVVSPLPSTWFPPGWSFGTNTLSIQAGDQWSGLGLWIQEWLPAAGE